MLIDEFISVPPAFNSISKQFCRRGKRLRVEIWTMSIGGHPNLARALSHAFKEVSSDDIEIKVRDIYSPAMVPLVVSRIFGAYWRVINYFPLFWGVIFRFSSNRAILAMIRFAISIIINKKLVRELEEWEPDLVVTVCPTLGQMNSIRVLRRHTRCNPVVVTFVADPVIIHPSWVAEDTDYYIATSEHAVNALCYQWEVEEKKVILGGFPIEYKFRQQKALTKSHCRTLLGIEPQAYVVLILGGSSGAGNIPAGIKAILSQNTNIFLIVVCGHNRHLLKKLQAIEATITNSKRRQLKVYGWRDDIHLLMSAADAVVTKAGPGTTMEAVRLARPIIFFWATPGQEERNIEYYAQELRIGLVALSPKELAKQVMWLHNSVKTQNKLRQRQTIINNADAEKKIVECLISLVPR